VVLVGGLSTITAPIISLITIEEQPVEYVMRAKGLTVGAAEVRIIRCRAAGDCSIKGET